MKEAMQQVKAELGADAVILHTKKYREGGILGFNAREVVEVTAAIEDTPEPPKKREAPKKRPAAKRKSRIDVVSEPEGDEIPPVTTAQQSRGIRTYQSSQGAVPPAGAPAPAPAVAAAPAPPTPEEQAAAQARFDALIEALSKQTEAALANPHIIKADQAAARTAQPPQAVPQGGQASVPSESVQPPQEEQPQKEAAQPTDADDDEKEKEEEEQEQRAGDEEMKEEQDKIRELQEELAQMKTLLAQVMVKDQPKGVRTLQEALKEQEVSDDILHDLAATVAAGDTVRDSLTKEAHDALSGYLEGKVKFSSGIESEKFARGPKIIALIGATGVGKTTTLAKIAARFVLEQGIDAALITADTYRISAVEQLKTYSDILGLPLEIVYTPQELKTAIHKFRKKDLILVDTAGRSQHNEFQMKELCDFLAVHPRISRYLVMSATTKNRDAADILEKFSVCEPDHLIFTKTDETASVGLILNLLYEKELSLAFFTNGQSVPDDIVPATPDALADLLLRE